MSECLCYMPMGVQARLSWYTVRTIENSPKGKSLYEVTLCDTRTAHNVLDQQTNDGDESAKRSRDRIYDVYCFSSTSGW